MDDLALEPRAAPSFYRCPCGYRAHAPGALRYHLENRWCRFGGARLETVSRADLGEPAPDGPPPPPPPWVTNPDVWFVFGDWESAAALERDMFAWSVGRYQYVRERP